MLLVIIIPCLNEEKTIQDVISRIPKQIEGISEIRIVVVDDGSSDRTADLARKAGATVISHGENLGVGAAFNTGIEAAVDLGADIVVNMDGDGQFNPRDIPILVKPILNGQADFVTASRFMDKSLTPEMPAVKKWGNRRIARMVSMLIRKRFYDVSCGFRAYSKEAILKLNLIGKFTYTQETFLDLAFKGVKIKEVPLKIKGEREFGKSRVAANLFKYAIQSAKIIIRTYRDYKPMEFFGRIAFILFFFSVLIGAFFMVHYLKTGHFSPNLWAGFTSGFLFLFGVLFFVTGLLADMFDRIRKNQEKLLYIEKKKIIDQRQRARQKTSSGKINQPKSSDFMPE